LKTILDLEYVGEEKGMKSFRAGETRMFEVKGDLTSADSVDSVIGKDFAVFLSMHSSARGIAMFTVHAEGNWGDEAILGGKPKKLSTASPSNMLSALKGISKRSGDLQATYEATHHGPLLDAPSFFVEVGGTDEATNSKKMAGSLANAISDFLYADKAEFGKVAIGIGGTHYPEKFTKLALDGTYAFAHIMPKYNSRIDMLRQAVERSDEPVETAVIEWKSFNSEQRGEILQELERIGIDHEKA